MTGIGELAVNPFQDDVVTEPRRISYSVKGLNDGPLEQLIETFHKLTVGETPRRPIRAEKAQLVVSPDRGYGKSHLLGRLFGRLREEATLIYLRPFQNPQRMWSSILQATLHELERPTEGADGAGSQLEVLSKGVLAHVAFDDLAHGAVGDYSAIENAVRHLRPHPLKVLDEVSGSRGLIDWIKSSLDERPHRLSGLIRRRGIDLVRREAAWLKVLAGYAFNGAETEHREAAIKWLRGDPLEAEEASLLKLAVADNEGRADSSARDIDELSRQRLKGLCILSSYYRPFVFCFDQTEFYGGDRELVNALGSGIEALYSTIPNHLTIVTTNTANWTNDVFPLMEPAYRDRFSPEISLEGINIGQAEELITARLTELGVDDAAVAAFTGEGWLEQQFGGLRQIGVRDLLKAAAERFRSLAEPAEAPRPKPPLADLFAGELNAVRADKALQRYNQDCLMWFAEALAAGYGDVEIRRTRGRYFAIAWAWPDRSVYFAFESGDNNARWRAIVRDATSLIGPGGRSRAIVFRTPDQTAIPRPTWRDAKAQINEAQKRGFRIVTLSLDEVCELHAARELYSNALQGNINYDPPEVLAWFKAHFKPWFERYSAATGEEAHADEGPPPAAAPAADPEPPAAPDHPELTAQQADAVLACVRQRMLVDINEVLATLGDPSLRPAVLRAIDGNPAVKAHPGPQTIYLQWRIVA
jgi:hypothetical protein